MRLGFTRFVLCGAISGYNSASKQTAGVRKLTRAIVQRVTLKGLVICGPPGGNPQRDGTAEPLVRGGQAQVARHRRPRWT